jgi:hypothetical protein
VRALAEHYFDVDVRDVLPLIRVPTLVLDREGDNGVAAGCAYLAEHIAGARHVVLAGSDRVMFGGGDSVAVLREIKTFLDAAWSRHTRDTHAHPRGIPSPGAIAPYGSEPNPPAPTVSEP